MELSGLPKDMGAFRAPSLRNVEVTAPYMHDGSVASLEAVLDIIADGGRNITTGVNAGDGRQSPVKSPLVTPLALSTQDKADLIAFLKTLTDHEFLTNPKLSDPFKVP
jgi:cytochrome c peroxidase